MTLRTRLRASPLGLKLALLSALVTAAVVAVTFLALRASAAPMCAMRSSPSSRRVNAGCSGCRIAICHLLIATSSVVSTSPTLRAALQTGRVETNAGLPARPDLLATIQREVERLFAGLDRDLLIVTDDSGRVLAAVGRGGRAGGAPAKATW